MSSKYLFVYKGGSSHGRVEDDRGQACGFVTDFGKSEPKVGKAFMTGPIWYMLAIAQGVNILDPRFRRAFDVAGVDPPVMDTYVVTSVEDDGIVVLSYVAPEAKTDTAS